MNSLYLVHLACRLSPSLPGFITLCHKLSEIVAQLEILRVDGSEMSDFALKRGIYETRKK